MEDESNYSIYGFEDCIKQIQKEAIQEVVTVTRGANQPQTTLTGSCQALSMHMVKGMARVLNRWADERGLCITDLEDPCARPEALRLQYGSSIWPRRNRTVLMMPLNNQSAKVELVSRGSKNHVTINWNPENVIQLYDMGLRFYGSGSIRFIAVVFRVTNPSRFPMHWALAAPRTDERAFDAYGVNSLLCA